MFKEVQYCEKIIKTKFKKPLKMSSEDEQNFNALKSVIFVVRNILMKISV